MIYYVCKYTPIELFRGFGEECSVLEEMPENFEQSDQIAHANVRARSGDLKRRMRHIPGKCLINALLSSPLLRRK